MASMVDSFETDLLELLFLNTTLANFGDTTGLVGSTGAGTARLALAASGTPYTDASTSLGTGEVSYTGYARPTPARSGAGWTVTNDAVTNAALIQFGERSDVGTATAVHLGVGFYTDTTIHLHQDLNADLSITQGVNPQFAIGALSFTAA
jgi:hypothetical protein